MRNNKMTAKPTLSTLCFLVVSWLGGSCSGHSEAGSDTFDPATDDMFCNLIHDTKCGLNSNGQEVALECLPVSVGTDRSAVIRWQIVVVCDDCCVAGECVSRSQCDADTMAPDAADPQTGDAQSQSDGGCVPACSPGFHCHDGECRCVPECEGMECGSDGCGGSCGTCAWNDICDDGICICVPACDGKQCGLDGCGGSCGECEADHACEGGLCICIPDCKGKECGNDGCGGVCGVCPESVECVDGVCGHSVNPCYPPCLDGFECVDGLCVQTSQCHPSNPCGWDCNNYCDCPNAAWDYNDCHKPEKNDCHSAECCQPGDPCGWANDQQCECGGDFAWDGDDCS